jgi:hypothetical protein
MNSNSMLLRWFWEHLPVQRGIQRFALTTTLSTGSTTIGSHHCSVMREPRGLQGTCFLPRNGLYGFGRQHVSEAFPLTTAAGGKLQNCSLAGLAVQSQFRPQHHCPSLAPMCET